MASSLAVLLAAAICCLGGSTGAVAAPVPGPAPAAANLADGTEGEPEAAPRYYFYRRLGYGTDAQIHPLRMIINGGYGIFQIDNRDNRPWDVDYRNGVTNVWKNISDPFGSIQAEGWGEFFFRELLPVSVRRKHARYWPNYTQHLIGGGMSYRLMAEWYRYHGFAHPRTWSVATMAVYHFLNEVVENDRTVGWTTDPVADLLIFDPLGILLFESDRVARFFGEKLSMSDWSYQPCYDPWQGSLENNGQNFALKYRLRARSRWSLFYHYGTHAELGLSHTWTDGRCLSAGAGFKAKNLVEVGPGTKTVDLAASAGIFYDRHHSLLASLLFAYTKDYRLRLNMYPGLVRLGRLQPGVFMGLTAEERFIAGITVHLGTQWPIGLARMF